MSGGNQQTFTSFMLQRVERERREYLIKHYKLPNLIVMGYTVFDNLIAQNHILERKKNDPFYTLLGMRVLLYPETGFKNDWTLHFIDREDMSK